MRTRQSGPTRLLMATLFVAALSPALSPALAQRPFAPQPDEIPALPDACRVRLDHGTKAEWTAWQTKLGRPIWDHLHHLCYAMNFMNRQATEMDKPTRRNQLQQAINNYNYVLGRWPQTHPLYAEAAAGKARAEMIMQTVRK